MRRPGRDEVVSLLQGVSEESLRHLGADHVGSRVFLIGVAATIPKIAGQWIVRARHQGGTQHIQGLR